MMRIRRDKNKVRGFYPILDNFSINISQGNLAYSLISTMNSKGHLEVFIMDFFNTLHE